MKKVIFIAITVICASLLSILFLEVVLKTFSPLHLTGGYIGAYEYDQALGVRLKPGRHFLKTTDYQQEVHTNPDGTINFQESFDQYRYRVFALGDSYTQGTGLPSDANYPFQLDMMLNLRDGEYLSRYAVINLGLAAFGGEQAILSLGKFKEIIGEPDYILYMGSSNDYNDDILFKSGYRHRHLVDGSPRWGILLKPLQWFANETELGKRLKISVSTLRRRKLNVNRRQEASPRKRINIAAKQEMVFNRLLMLSTDCNATLIVSWSGSPRTPSDSYQWLKGWAGKNNVAFADWHPLVEAVQDQIPNLPLGNPHSGGHYRTWVNHIIAKAFATHITDESKPDR
jgi:lysophospholipase L1-like esterase